MTDVKSERQGAILICTLNRPEHNNSITAEVFEALYTEWTAADRDPDCHVILTTHEGDNFCVGADGNSFEKWTQETLTSTFRREFSGKQGLPPLSETEADLDPLGMNRWALMVCRIRTPMIAVMRGVVAGGGLGLALLHHFRFSDETAKFTNAFGRLGLSFELGMSHLLPDLIGRQNALEFALTSKIIDAKEAHEIGLIDHLVPANDLMAAAHQLASTIAKQSPLAVRATMEAILNPRFRNLEIAMQTEFHHQKILWESDEFRERARKLFSS